MIIRDTFEFSVFDAGLDPIKPCGLMFSSNLKRNRKITGQYKPIDIPYEMMQTYRFSDYWGILEVLPETFICINGTVDPPDSGLRPDTMHYCRVIEYHIK